MGSTRFDYDLAHDLRPHVNATNVPFRQRPAARANVPASCRDPCRSYSVKRDQICKAVQKSREKIARPLVREATLGVELLVRSCHEDLRL
jgi:hypothetical protein